ncbi:unnamed protein product [Orchesella dallaii]|uniref:Uncharacterized protein n=1 Tax=Orchesella dallaii TaxID=48710 RepID=A0ABP1PV95_9HEXA
MFLSGSFQLPPTSLLESAKESPAKKTEKTVTFQGPPPPAAPAPKVVKPPPKAPPNPIPAFTAKTVIIEERNGHTSSTPDPPIHAKSPTPTHQEPHQLAPARPESPSPDYSNSPSPSPSPPRIRSPPMGVDMESLESFRLKNPPKNVQKPPPFYFNESAKNGGPGPNGPGPKTPHYGGMDDKKVRMSAYPSAYNRPEPGKFGFIGKGSGGHPVPAALNGAKTEVILHRELEDALSRCNLNNSNPRDTPNNPANGKLTILVGTNGVHNQCQNQSVQNGGNYCNGKCTSNGKTASQANGKPNGGILKMSNGSSSSSSNKTISFGGRY